MADLVRLVKMAIWIGGIEIFIGGEQWIVYLRYQKTNYHEKVLSLSIQK